MRPGVPCSSAASVPLGHVLDVDERPDAAAVADDRELARLEHLPLLAAGGEARAGAVEAAVAQRDPAGAGDRRLEVLDRLERRAHLLGGLLVQRVVLGLDRPADARVRARPRSSGRSTRSTPASRAAASRWSVPSVRRRLVSANERSNLRRSRSPPSAVIWWTIASGRASATAARTPSRSSPSTTTGSAPSSRSMSRSSRAAGGADDGVAVAGEEGDERLTDGAGRPGEKDLHAPPTRRHASL